jgi:hypothetical protein
MAFLTLLDDFEGTKIPEPKTFMVAGQVIEVRGTFDDGSDAGAGLAVVIGPCKDKRAYYVRFVEVVSEDWAWHLFDREDASEMALIKIMKGWGDTVEKVYKGEIIEWITGWRVVAERNDEVDLNGVPWIQSKAKAIKSIVFVRGFMSSDKAPIEATLHLSQ